MRQPESRASWQAEVELVDPVLWLEQRVVGILNCRIGTTRRLARECKCEPYFGRTAGMWGYLFCFEHRHPQFNYHRRFLMFSRTHYALQQPSLHDRPQVEDLVRELETQVVRIPLDKFGRYHEELDVPGTYATVECRGAKGRYYYMISESGIMEPFNFEVRPNWKFGF